MGDYPDAHNSSDHAEAEQRVAPPDGLASQWDADVVMRDGATMHIRALTAADGQAVRDLHAEQSESSVYFRFFAPRTHLSDDDVASFTQVDQQRDVSLGVFEGSGPTARLRGIGGFNTTAPGRAEVAFYVADSQQGRGLGSVLFDHLAAAAREVGVQHFEAFVLPANRKMINVFKDAGYRLTTALDDGVIEIVIALRSTTQAWKVMTQREQRSEALAMEHLMNPDAFVIIDDDGGLAAVRDRLEHAQAPLADPTSDTLAGHLALISTTADRLLSRLQDCADRGVRAAVLYSGAAYATGGDYWREILRTARGCGIRLLGPTSFGIVTANGWDLTLAGIDAQAEDGVDVFVQSAEVALQLSQSLAAANLPIRTLVAAGHRLDISGNDTMQYWAAHPRSVPALICLDTMGNARKFARIARNLATMRPVFALITAGTGSRLVPGHMVATSSHGPQVLGQVLRQSGVLATTTLTELVQVTDIAVHAGVPRDATVRVLASSPTLAAMAEAVILRHGGDLVRTDICPLEPGSVPPEPGEGGGGVLALTGLTKAEQAIARECAAAFAQSVGEQAVAASSPQPWIAVGPENLGEHRLAGPGLPYFADLDTGVHQLLRLGQLQQVRDRIADTQLVDYPDLEPGPAHALVRRLASQVPGPAGEHTAELLGYYGIELLPTRTVTTVSDSIEAAKELGYPVVVKSRQHFLRHRTDLGGVALDLPDARAVESVAQRFQARGDESWDIQPMAPPGAACVLRAWEDDLYGPILAFALAGDAEEILHDISYRIAPLTSVDARTMIDDVAASVRLRGYRGVPPLDVGALSDLIGRLSMLKDDLVEVNEVRLHPVIVGESGVCVAGAEIHIAPRRRRDDTRRTLREPTTS